MMYNGHYYPFEDYRMRKLAGLCDKFKKIPMPEKCLPMVKTYDGEISYHDLYWELDRRFRLIPNRFLRNVGTEYLFKKLEENK